MTNASRLLIKNGTLIDGTGREPTTNALIAVQGNRITQVGRRDGPSRPETPDDTVIDAAGKYILPGLIDAHCHISLHQGALPAPGTGRAPNSAPYGRRTRSAVCCAPASPASPCRAANGLPM